MNATKVNPAAVRALRLGSGLGHAEFCRRAGIAESTLWRIEHSKFNPRIETIGKLAQVLEVSVDALLIRGERAA